jgi:hypothetical protein
MCLTASPQAGIAETESKEESRSGGEAIPPPFMVKTVEIPLNLRTGLCGERRLPEGCQTMQIIPRR